MPVLEMGRRMREMEEEIVRLREENDGQKRELESARREGLMREEECLKWREEEKKIVEKMKKMESVIDEQKKEIVRLESLVSVPSGSGGGGEGREVVEGGGWNEERREMFRECVSSLVSETEEVAEIACEVPGSLGVFLSKLSSLVKSAVFVGW